MKTNKVLVTLANESYLDQAKQLFSSAYFNAGWDGDFLLLAHEVSEDKLQWFKDKGIFIKMCSAIEQNDYRGIVSPVAFSKFYLFTPEIKKWDKAIFFDGDIIIKRNIFDLLKTDGLTAIRDLPFNNISAFDLLKPNTEKEKELCKSAVNIIPAECNTFNSGVISLDTKMVTDNSFNNLVDLAKKYASVNNTADQLILNLMFAKGANILSDHSYNFLLLPTSRLAVLLNSNPHVLHFAGPIKPWNIDNPYRKTWLKNLSLADKIIIGKPPKVKSLGFYDRLIFVINFIILKKPNHSDSLKNKIIGHVGIMIKRLSPSFYHFIKSYEK
ncbi:MAG: glycosyltransferase [bacterium]